MLLDGTARHRLSIAIYGDRCVLALSWSSLHAIAFSQGRYGKLLGGNGPESLRNAVHRMAMTVFGKTGVTAYPMCRPSCVHADAVESKRATPNGGIGRETGVLSRTRWKCSIDLLCTIQDKDCCSPTVVSWHAILQDSPPTESPICSSLHKMKQLYSLDGQHAWSQVAGPTERQALCCT